MRFAIGSVPQLEQFMSGINMGGLAQGGTDLRSKEKSTGIELQGKVGGAGLRAKGEAISGALLGDARAAAGRSQMMGQIFQTLGQVGGSAMAYGNFGRPSMNSPIAGVNDNPIPGQTTDVIRGAQGTIVDPSMTGVPDYTISPGFSGDRLIIG